MRFCSIASGSSGNCIYVGSDATHLLIDAGISCKRVEEGLKGLDLKASDLDGILITHEHSDHIKGIEMLVKKYQIPIYATSGTLRYIRQNSYLSTCSDDLFIEIHPDEKTLIKDCSFQPFRISHDACDPVGYRVNYGKRKVAVCTDIGAYNEYTVENLKNLDALLLEANHDIKMLQVGPYPYYLKRRILGDRGHLSNENSGRLLSRILHDNLQTVMLGHLSKENNIPELAYEAVRMEVTMADCPYTGDDFKLMVAKRDEPSPVIEL